MNTGWRSCKHTLNMTDKLWQAIPPVQLPTIDHVCNTPLQRRLSLPSLPNAESNPKLIWPKHSQSNSLRLPSNRHTISLVEVWTRVCDLHVSAMTHYCVLLLSLLWLFANTESEGDVLCILNVCSNTLMIMCSSVCVCLVLSWRQKVWVWHYITHCYNAPNLIHICRTTCVSGVHAIHQPVSLTTSPWLGVNQRSWCWRCNQNSKVAERVWEIDSSQTQHWDWWASQYSNQWLQ